MVTFTIREFYQRHPGIYYNWMGALDEQFYGSFPLMSAVLESCQGIRSTGNDLMKFGVEVM